jgi:predicted esterase
MGRKKRRIVSMKRISSLLLVSLLALGCGREAGEPNGVPPKGNIFGEVRVKKPPEALIFVAIGSSIEELARGRFAKLVVMRDPGPFVFDAVEAGTYRLGAYVDINANRLPDFPFEPYFVLESALSVAPGKNIKDVEVEGFFNERDPLFKTIERILEYQELRDTAWTSVERAYQELKAGGSNLLLEVIPSLRAMVFEAERTWIAAGNASDWEHIRALLGPIPELSAGALAGDNLLGSTRGCFLRAYLSELDESIQPYAVSVPEAYDDSRPFPLVIALHGAGGDHWDGMKMVTGCSDLLIGAEESNSHFFPCALPPDFIVACPSGHGYVGPGYRGPGEYDVLRVHKEMRSHYNIDTNRVYLTGASKGGRGVWEIGLKYSELFAAIAPVCGGTDLARTLARRAGGLGVFVFHGSNDAIISVHESRTMVDLLRQLDIPVEYTEYEEMGHDASWLIYRDGAIFDLFRRQDTESSV